MNLARPEAIVVGGGWAGVSAALTLADRGARVLLLEARRMWGGRATSWPDPKLGDPVDNGQHVLLGCYAATRALLRRLGTESHVHFQAGLDVTFREPGGATSRLLAPAGLGRAGLALGLFAWGRVSLPQRIALARTIATAPAPDPASTVDEWLTAVGAGIDARRFFWHPLTEAVVNEAPDRAPASLLFEAMRRAFRGAPGDAAIGLATTGLAGLVAPVVDRLADCEGMAFLGHDVDHVAPGPHGHRVVLDDGRTFDSACVVLAVPAAEARTLVSAGYPDVARDLDAAASVPGSPIVTVTRWYAAPLLHAPIVGFVAPRTGAGPPFAWAFDRSGLLGAPDGRHAITLVASAAHALAAMPTAQVLERADRTLVAYGFRAPAPLGGRVVREPRATPAYDPLTVRARPPVASRRAGLAVAGDWTESPLPATIEAAVLSGQSAAAAVLTPSPGARA